VLRIWEKAPWVKGEKKKARMAGLLPRVIVEGMPSTHKQHARKTGQLCDLEKLCSAAKKIFEKETGAEKRKGSARKRREG